MLSSQLHIPCKSHHTHWVLKTHSFLKIHIQHSFLALTSFTNTLPSALNNASPSDISVQLFLHHWYSPSLFKHIKILASRNITNSTSQCSVISLSASITFPSALDDISLSCLSFKFSIMSHLTSSFTISLPMPMPGSPNVPLFKGQHVTDFLDLLEAHATAANIALNNLPAFVVQYCRHPICNIINTSTIWTQNNWSAGWSHLINLYGSNYQKPRIMPDQLWKWIWLHAENKVFLKLQDVDHYYQEFIAQAMPLTTEKQITENEANLLFYRGIPSLMHKKVKQKIPEAHQLTLSSFLTPRGVNHRLEPVQTNTKISKTATEWNGTGPLVQLTPKDWF